jgi:hypothetical protein
MPIHPVPGQREPPPDDEGEYDLSQLSDPDDDIEEEEEDEIVDTAPPVAVDPEPVAPKRRGGRPRKPQDPKPVGVGATIREPKQFWKSRDIEVLWPEVLEKIRELHHTPWDVDIRVKRTEPQEMSIGPTFPGGTVMGGNGKAASTQIVDKITDEYHMASGTMGPATYKIEIFWRVNSKVFTWGTLRCQSPDAIMAMRRQQQQQAVQPGGPMGWSGPYYPPPPAYPQLPPQYAPPYAGYGAPPPQAPPHSNEDTTAMRAEIGYLRGTLDEVLRASREGRQPNIQPMPPAGVGTPAGPPGIEEIARRVVEMLRPGFGNPVMATPTVAPTPAVSTFEASVQTIMQGMMQGVLKKVGHSVEQAIRGDGPATQATEAVAEVIPPEDPREHLPFESIEVGSKWPDGRPVMFPRDKETGSINMMGIAFANPFLAEKMADAASSFASNVGDLVKNMGRAAMAPGTAEVVNNIPRGAVQAGMGQPQAPPMRQAPPPHPQVAQQAPQPASNGVAQVQDNGGWPTG